MDARWQGQTHRIELNKKLDYHGPLFSARLDPDTFELEQIEATETAGDSDKPSLEPVAAMYVLLKGFSQSLPHFPSALPAGLAATGKIAHPGYME
jgi:hypothetical protein